MSKIRLSFLHHAFPCVRSLDKEESRSLQSERLSGASEVPLQVYLRSSSAPHQRHVKYRGPVKDPYQSSGVFERRPPLS
eukprot:7832846-Pyramimonas_sp.AAC.1